MLHAGIDALFGRNRDGQRTRNIFQRRRPSHPKDAQDDLSKFFSTKPHLDKHMDHGSTFGFAAMQGWRSSMEDRHKHLIPLDKHSWKSWSFFAIFDGHNGICQKQRCFLSFKKKKLFVFAKIQGICAARNSADRLDSHLLRELNRIPAEPENNVIKAGVPICSSQVDLDQLHCAIKQSYYKLDQDLRNVVKDDSGCVCVRFRLFFYSS